MADWIEMSRAITYWEQVSPVELDRPWIVGMSILEYNPSLPEPRDTRMRMRVFERYQERWMAEALISLYDPGFVVP